MHDFDPPTQTKDAQDAMLDELEVRCTTNVAPLREAKIQRRRVRVAVRPANACDRNGLRTELLTSETSEHGLAGIAPSPVMVGSYYHLEFDREVTDNAPALAVCDRCTMLGDESFDLRFRFAQPVDLNHG
ncbi:MAG: hypothetical protein KAI24_09960 [Planctomycetes bacterium]|nr:hypothetical protein [Planctomycetota bacterium]